MATLIGAKLGAYEIKLQIGRGGIATVYKAYHPPTDREVAVKILSSDVANDPTFIERFDREAKFLANLQHIHILPVFDYGHQEDMAYLVMPLITQGSLGDQIRKTPLATEEVARLFRQIAAALDYAHQRGLLHRDIKPGNVLMDTSKNALLADFGLARIVIGEETSNLTQSMVVGTPAYMSPEQGQGLPLDSRSDLYSMGVMLYEMLAGTVPYKAETPVAVIFRHISDPHPSILELRPELGSAVDAVLHRAMAKQPADRYATALEIADALEMALQPGGSAIIPPKQPVMITVSNTHPATLTEGEVPTYIGDLQTRQHLPDDPTSMLKSDVLTKQTKGYSPTGKQRLMWGVLVGIILAITAGVYFLRPSDNPQASETRDNALLRSIDAHDESVLSVAYSPDGTRLLTGGADNLARVWDTATGTMIYNLEVHSGDVLSVAYSPNADVMLTGGGDAMSYTWDAETGTQSIMNLTGSPVQRITYSPTGAYHAYIANQNLSIASRAVGYAIHSLVNPDETFFTAVAFSPDEDFLVTGDRAGRLHFWDTSNGQMTKTHTLETGAITDLAYSPDGKSLVVADQTGTVRLLDLTEETFAELPIEAGALYVVAYHPDGNQIALAGEDGLINLWNPVEQTLIAELTGHTGVILDLAYNMDGTQLASAGEDGTLRVWDIDVEVVD